MNEFRVTTNIEEMDFEKIYRFISNSYWAKGIPKKIMIKAIENSLSFAVINTNNQLIGFARMITDRATFAYLADVFIEKEYRGLGLSRFLVSAIISHSELQGLRRVMLATKDAHGLYEKFGFERIENQEMLMQILQPNVYQKS